MANLASNFKLRIYRVFCPKLADKVGTGQFHKISIFFKLSALPIMTTRAPVVLINEEESVLTSTDDQPTAQI